MVLLLTTTDEMVLNKRTTPYGCGMSVIFMKTDGNVLDRNDAYQAVWIGNKIGGSPSALAGDGTPIVGFAAPKRGEKNNDLPG